MTTSLRITDVGPGTSEPGEFSYRNGLTQRQIEIVLTGGLINLDVQRRVNKNNAGIAYAITAIDGTGCGFPIAPLGAITSLSCGAILNVGFCRYAGKGQREVSLLRRMWNILRPGDVLLADSLMSNWTSIAMLQERGFELVSRLNKAHRKADFRKGIAVFHRSLRLH